jgi:RNA polymerase primary sigma factor
MQRALQQQTRTIRIPVHVGQELARVRAAERRLATELGRDPMPEEVAKAVDLSIEQLEDLRAAERIPVSLESRVGADGDTELGALLPQEGPTPFDELEVELAETSIRKALERLDPRGREVIKLRFGLDGSEPLPLREVAKRMGLSAEGVRKLERRALRTLAEERELQALSA